MVEGIDIFARCQIKNPRPFKGMRVMTMFVHQLDTVTAVDYQEAFIGRALYYVFCPGFHIFTGIYKKISFVYF